MWGCFGLSSPRGPALEHGVMLGQRLAMEGALWGRDECCSMHWILMNTAGHLADKWVLYYSAHGCSLPAAGRQGPCRWPQRC